LNGIQKGILSSGLQKNNLYTYKMIKASKGLIKKNDNNI